MKIAITGSSGFIGQSFLKTYCENNSFIAYTSQPDSPHLFRHDNIAYVALPIIDGQKSGDNAEQFSKLSECDAAINLGFARSTPGKVGQFSDFVPSIMTADALFAACHRLGITNVVHVSTQAVYGKQLPIPHSESEPQLPFSFYGAAKTASEALASVYNTTLGMRIKVLRLAQVLGVGEHQGVVAAYIQAAKQGESLKVWGRGDESAREYIYIDDVCSAIMTALEHPELAGTYNIGTGATLTAGELATAISNACAGTAPVEFLPDKPVECIDFCMQVDRAKEELGWACGFSPKDAIKKMMGDA